MDSDNNPMAALATETEFMPGEAVVVSAPSPCTSFAAVFEDDGETGYFYALDTGKPDQIILDALHVYDVAKVVDKQKVSRAEVVWSVDGLRVVLRINGYSQPAFDFAKGRGYCRTGFPHPAAGEFSSIGHGWSDEVLDFFK